jgi:hypothetical protein
MSTTSVTKTGEGTFHEKGKVDKELNRLSGSYFIFLIVMVIVFLAIAVMFSVNAFYFDRIRKAFPSSATGTQFAATGGTGTTIGGLTRNDADGLFYANIAFAIATGIIFFALIIVLFLGVWKPNAVEKVRASVGRVTDPVKTAVASGARRTGAAAYAGGKEFGKGLARGVGDVAQGTTRAGTAAGGTALATQ